MTLDTGLSVRHAARSGALDAPTSGLAYGYVQGNLAILPRDCAEDFLRFCQANPKPCPLLGVSEPGDPAIPALGADLDIRTDIPRYRVWRDGELVDEPRDIKSVWRDDLVSFVLGCSFSFEEALLAADVPVRHIALKQNVPMYRTNMPTQRAGRFHGPLVVSMRPMKPADAIRAVQITSRLPAVHGAPVHLGFPEADRHRGHQPSPTTATRSRSNATSCRCSGPAASRRRPRSRRRACRSRSRMRPATCW